jgi:hypothetical protein
MSAKRRERGIVSNSQMIERTLDLYLSDAPFFGCGRFECRRTLAGLEMSFRSTLLGDHVLFCERRSR